MSDVCPVENAQLSDTPQISSHTQPSINHVALQFLTQNQAHVQTVNSGASRTDLSHHFCTAFRWASLPQKQDWFPSCTATTQTNSAQISGTAPGYPRKREPLSLSIRAGSLKARVSALNSCKTPLPPIPLFVTHICFTTKCGRSALALPGYLSAPPVVLPATHSVNLSSAKHNAGTHEAHTHPDIQTPSTLLHSSTIIQKFSL